MTILPLIFLILFHFTLSHKLLVISGYNTNYKDYVVKTEVIDLEDQTNTCQNLPDFPVQIHGATGGLIEVLGRNAALVCGGTYFLELEPRCYAIFEDATTVIGMSIHRAYGSSVIINNTNLWITGGLTYGTSLETLYQSLSSTEVIDAQYKTHTPGPKLPQKLYSHCALSINQKEVMIVGGYKGESIWDARGSPTTYFYHFDHGWRTGPDMMVARADLACTILEAKNRQNYVVATGGVNGGFLDTQHLKSTEVYSLVENRWFWGPDLPLNLAAHSMVALENKVYVIGGLTPGNGLVGITQSKIYEMDDNMDQWRQMKQKLSVARYYTTVLVVPDTMVSC